MDLDFALCTLRRPDAPAKVLKWLTRYSDAEVDMTLNDDRTARLTLSIYDEATEHVRPHETMLYAIYRGQPVFRGAIDPRPKFDAQAGTVQMTFTGPAKDRLGVHFLGLQDDALDGQEENEITADGRGIAQLVQAGLNTTDQLDRGDPDLDVGVDNGADDHDVPITVHRLQEEVWSLCTAIADIGLIEFDVVPYAIDSGEPYYARIKIREQIGIDRTSTVRFYHGHGPSNAANVQWDPGAGISHVHVFTNDGKERVTRANIDASNTFGPRVAAISADFDSTAGHLDALQLRAEAEVKVRGFPPNFLTVVPKLDAAGALHFGEDYFLGDRIWVDCKRGYMRPPEGEHRIVAVRLKAPGPRKGVQPELVTVPTIGDGTIIDDGD